MRRLWELLEEENEELDFFCHCDVLGHKDPIGPPRILGL